MTTKKKQTKSEPAAPMCAVCNERPVTHESIDKKQLCDVCETPTQAAHNAPKPMPGRKIVAMQIENVKRIKLVRFRPKGSTVIVSGKNGSGKTSLLDAYDFAVRGTTKIPSQPIRKGERTATVQVDFGDFKVERTFTRVDGGKEPYLTKLNVYGKNKEKYPTPQTLIDAWNHGTSFDPLAFARMEPKKQLETLRRMVTLDVDLDKIEAEKKAAYDARRDAGRDVDAAKARLAAFSVPDPNLPDEPIDTAALTKQLEEAANHNNLVAAQEQAKQRKIEEADGNEQRCYDITAEIGELKKKIEQLEQEHATAADAARRLRKEAEKMEVGKRTDTAEVAQQLTTAAATNDAIRHRNAYRMAVQSVQTAEDAWAKHDIAVKTKDQERIDAIARAKFPIEDLGFSEDEVLYKGLPFNQASHAEQIRVSVALGIAWNPELRVMLIRDGDLLDNETLALVEGMVAENDYQLLIERIDAGGRPCITMEDGEASGAEVEQVPAR